MATAWHNSGGLSGPGGLRSSGDFQKKTTRKGRNTPIRVVDFGCTMDYSTSVTWVGNPSGSKVLGLSPGIFCVYGVTLPYIGVAINLELREKFTPIYCRVESTAGESFTVPPQVDTREPTEASTRSRLPKRCQAVKPSTTNRPPDASAIPLERGIIAFYPRPLMRTP